MKIIIDKVLEFVNYRSLRQRMSKTSWISLIQFVKFGIVGVSNTIVGYIVYAISLQLLRLQHMFEKYDVFIAQVVMFILSVAWSFYWNNKAVFNDDDEEICVGRALLKTYVTYAFTGLFLSEILLILWVRILGINEYIAPIINLIVTVPLNFLLQKYWAFRKN